LSPKLGRLDNKDFSSSGSFESMRNNSPIGPAQNRSGFTGNEICFLKRALNARERLSQARVRSDIVIDLVQAPRRRQIELGQSAVTEDSQRGHALTDIRKSHSTVIA
jgi:hypothetical protein